MFTVISYWIYTYSSLEYSQPVIIDGLISKPCLKPSEDCIARPQNYRNQEIARNKDINSLYIHTSNLWASEITRKCNVWSGTLTHKQEDHIQVMESHGNSLRNNHNLQNSRLKRWCWYSIINPQNSREHGWSGVVPVNCISNGYFGLVYARVNSPIPEGYFVRCLCKQGPSKQGRSALAAKVSSKKLPLQWCMGQSLTLALLDAALLHTNISIDFFTISSLFYFKT